ncbi:XK-related protein 8-like [Engraulis encrasicolus]|uniref:XK-related protein 8-like n=1 Tax=Engraulis encrasicolus TaxID=184585 RepID=UPI002FD29876
MAAILCLRSLFYLIWKIFSFCFFCLDVVLDVLAVHKLYREQDYVTMWVLIFLLVASSVLVQVFSWLWYDYSPEEQADTGSLTNHVYLYLYVKNRRLLGVYHVFQMGVIVRYAGVLEIAVRNLTRRPPLKGGIAGDLRHDLSLVRLFESFTENTPQLLLTLTILARREVVDWIIGPKALLSFISIAFNVLTYHRNMRSVNKNKSQLGCFSSLVYFLWNLFLLISRVAALALCAYVLPFGMLAMGLHFLFLWPMLLFGVWRLKTNFMEHPGKEWLYRATIALIWYFNWFSPCNSRSTKRHVIYHSFIAVDVALLMLLWWYLRDSTESFLGEVPAWVVCVAVAVLYSLGIMVKVLYYRLFHPEHSDSDKSGYDERAPANLNVIEMESSSGTDESDSTPPQPTGAQRRRQKMAANFYS